MKTITVKGKSYKLVYADHEDNIRNSCDLCARYNHDHMNICCNDFIKESLRKYNRTLCHADGGAYWEPEDSLYDDFKKIKEMIMAKKETEYTWSASRHLYIPTVGTVLELTEPWTFRLFDEYRNDKLVEYLGLTRKRPNTFGSVISEVTLMDGCRLKVDRIYIRKNGGEYDSITFFLDHAPPEMVFVAALDGAIGPGKTKRPRFWAKLSDVNKMQAKVAIDTLSDN
jgi:hypothetical protein